MAYKLMVQGTMSSAGKSFIVTALCRIFSDLGYKVAPFKSQNMALNSGVTFDGKEMGRAQIVQAEAARTMPDVRMNPILLKPNSDTGSQVIVMGKPIGNMKAREYYEYKPQLIPVIKEAFSALEKEYDVIIVEGAGSPAEINLKDNDIVNMGLAKMLDLPVLLVGDIDLGGVFAQLLGTLEWLDDEEKNRIKGLVINKFRGDVSLLKPGIDMLEGRTKKNVIGVVPYCKAKIDEEDSVTVDLRNLTNRRNIKHFDNNGHFDNKEHYNKKDHNKNECVDKQFNIGKKGLKLEDYTLKVYVIRLPHMSNFTDFTPLQILPYVELKYIDSVPENMNERVYEKSSANVPDLIIIPGSKSTISDLRWMKDTGLSEYVISMNGKAPIMGICGGNQILGKDIIDEEGIEGSESNTFAKGLSLINQSTTIQSEKTLTKTKSKIHCSKGFFKCLNGSEYEGYEIHSGVTKIMDTSDQIEALERSGDLSVFSDIKTGKDVEDDKDVFGTYVHGIFDKASVTKALIKGLFERKGLSDFDELLDMIIDYDNYKDREYDVAAKAVKDAIDMEQLLFIMGIK